MEIFTDENGNISLSQSGYLNKLLEEYKINTDAKYPSDSKILEEEIYKEVNDEELYDKSLYLTLIMKIMYDVFHY